MVLLKEKCMPSKWKHFFAYLKDGLKMKDYSRAVYYDDQSDWGCDDFYYLNRYLSRLLSYSDKKMDEIETMDLCRMSIETKTLLYVIILYKKLHSLLELESLKELNNIRPLEKRLNLIENPKGFYEIYEQFNIGW